MLDMSVVIPVYNEEGNIQLLYDRLTSVLNGMQLSYELLFINDGSKDKTLELVKGLAEQVSSVRYIDFSRNFGHQVAVTAGLEHTNGKTVVIIDADLQDPPELIQNMYEKHLEGFEVVYAKRKTREGENFMKLFTAKMFYRLLQRITDVEIPVDTGDFRLIDHQVVDVFRQMPERHKFIRGLVSWIGYRQTFVLYDRDARHSGDTGYSYGKMIRFAIDGITSFSTAPLKMATIFGFSMSAISFLFIFITIIYRMFSQGYFEPGWASLIATILFMGGVQLLTIGVIGEYVGRINTEIKGRPQYIVRETNAKHFTRIE